MSNSYEAHGNKVGRSSPERYSCGVRKIPADSVAYGTSISRNGRFVWGAFDVGAEDGALPVCIAASAREARRKYHDIMSNRISGGPGGGQNLYPFPK